MQAHALTAKEHSPFYKSANEGNLFLEALRNVQYGRITIITSHGKTLEFSGRESGPAAELMVNDWNIFDDLIARGETGFAEAYIDGRWESPDLPSLLTFALVNTDSLEKFFHGKPLYALWIRLKSFFKGNTLAGSKRNIMSHYDLGNDFYALWLDKSMTYSSALFEGDKNRSLEDAQQAKYTRILGKLSLQPGDHILDIGCGWGGFAIAAARHGARVTAVTVSQQQAQLAKEKVMEAGLSGKISVILKDYRELVGTFDHIVSIGMFEHVGEEYWPIYFRTVKNHLKPGGKAMIQCITLDDHLFEKLHGTYGFIEEYIFPGGMLPSKARFRKAAMQAGFACNEMFGFGLDYAITLRHWAARFEAQKPIVRKMGYDEQFLRLWDFYLASCIASFESRRTDVMQAELTNG
jgi:cyclopropane-fatty-acyl-phospholipid synthase